MRLTTAGLPRNFEGSIVGRITSEDLPDAKRREYIRFLPEGGKPVVDLAGYRAILSHDDFATDYPVIDRLRESDHFRDGDVIVLEGDSGFVRSLYRPYERHHSLFVTERCSSNCLMCSQPPKDKDDVESLTKRNQDLIGLMSPAPEYLTITGGEPTLLGDHLFELIDQLKTSLPNTELHTAASQMGAPSHGRNIPNASPLSNTPTFASAFRSTLTLREITITSCRLRARSTKPWPVYTRLLEMGFVLK